MNERLNSVVEGLREDLPGASAELAGMSSGEVCYIALAARRYDLLASHVDPLEAWYRLPPEWRAAVCRWRGWPEEWGGPAREEMELRRVWGTLDAAGVPSGGCPMLHTPAGRVRWLLERYAEARGALQDLYDFQNGPPLEREREEWEDAMRKAGAVLRSQSVD